MSTRAMYTFKDQYHTIHVYKHCDGYPSGGLSWIANARNHAWPLPRFEADDFAAGFVVANKDRGGDVRLCGPEVKEPYQMAADAEYHYVVTFKAKELHVEIHEVSWWDAPEEMSATSIYSGTLTGAIRKFEPKWIEPLNEAA